jgi:hypothetical protein
MWKVIENIGKMHYYVGKTYRKVKTSNMAKIIPFNML